MSDPFEAFLAGGQGAQSGQASKPDPFEAFLAGGNPAGEATPAPTTKQPFSATKAAKEFGQGFLGSTADVIDLVFDLASAPVAMASDTGTRAYLGVRNAADGGTLSRREMSAAGNKAAGAVNETIGGPARKALQALGILPPGEGLVGKAMGRAMQVAEQAGANLEANSGGAFLKEDFLTGINMLFGTLGAKGLQYTAKTAAERGKAKAALQELARIKEEGNARLAVEDAEALNREAGGIPRERRPQDNPAAADPNLETFDRRVNAERKAYELMQAGASKAKVEAAIKKDPAVGIALDDIREKREYYAKFLQEDASPPIREDGSFREGALSSMLRRPSEMGPAEARARDAAAGISRGPLGEPIFSADPRPQGPQRSSRDPSRRPVTDSGLMGVRAPAEPDVFGAAATGGRASPDPVRRPATGSGLEGQPVKRDSLGTPLSPNQTLAVVGATGLGLAAYYAGEGDTSDVVAAAAGGALLLGKGRGITLEAIHALPDTATLREIRDASAYTLNTLENLPGNRAVHSKQAVSELLRRQEVTKAERDILQGVLDSVPGETITAKQLMAGVKEATGDFELKPRASEQFADYGLENIDRAIAPDDYGNQSLAEMRAEYEQNAAQLRDEGPMLRERAAADEGVRFPDFPYGARQAANILRTLEDAQRTLPEQIAAAEQIEGKMEEPTTTIYQSPFELGSNNHFSDPNYFAHTRSFYENGVKHVVEMQSDLAQKAGKMLTGEERAKLVDAVDNLEKQADILTRPAAAKQPNTPAERADFFASAVAELEALNPDVKLKLGQTLEREGFQGSVPDLFDRTLEYLREGGEDAKMFANGIFTALYAYGKQVEVLKSEHRAKLKESGPLERVSPMLKRWDRRLVREELADSARGPNEALIAKLESLHEANLKVGVYTKSVKEALDKEKARTVQPVVRFATADTVAKVEGWPDQIGQAHQMAESRIATLEYDLRRLRDPDSGIRVPPRFGETVPEAIARMEAELIAQRRISADAKANAIASKAPRFAPEHQGIYDRYNKEVTSFLKQLGGKEVTDSAGHTWIEVPTEGTRKMPAGKRVQQFGAADPELVKTLAVVGGGVAVASLLSDPENKARNMVLAGVGASLAMFGRSHVSGLADMARSPVAAAERYLGMVSTRVGDMSPRLLRRMRDHEQGVLTRTNDYLKAIAPFVEGLRKIPEASRQALDAAILTGDISKITTALGKAGRPELVAEFRKARALLQQVGAELMQRGKLKGLLPDYYPRIVTDVPGLLKALGTEERTLIEAKLEQASRKVMKEALRDLTPFEQSQIINSVLKGGPSGTGKPGFLKKRIVGEVTPELAQFYAPASESLPLYLRAVGKELEKSRFFGENLVRDPVTGAVNLDESIGNVVREERQAGRITAEQAMELGDILKSRFGPGERAGSPVLQSVKNIAYAGLLGHVTSAITQLGDVVLSAAAHGILPTLKAIQQNVTGKAARVTMRDLGMIDHIAEEFVTASRKPVTVFGHQLSTAKFLEKVFKYSGFSLVDKIGKNVSIQASKNKLEGWTKSPAGLKQLQAKYGKAYTPVELQQLTADLRSGELTPLVKSVLFSELSDLQPISKLEVPQAYLDNPNGRALYMLKGFMLKQADIVRRNVWKNIKAGNYGKATEQGLRFGLALGIGGATTQWINNWLLGRDDPAEVSDIPVNMLKTFGWSQYTLDKVKQGKPLEAVVDMAAPPYKMFDKIVSADPSAIQYLPIIGRVYYARDWFDLLEESGSEKANRRLEREERRKEREE